MRRAALPPTARRWTPLLAAALLAATPSARAGEPSGRIDRTADLVHLLASSRPDAGFALLIGMARLGALERSVATERLVVLDGFPAHPRELPAAIVRRHEGELRAILAERRAELARARDEAFASGDIGEATWSRLETAASVLLEIEAALERGAPLRLHPGPPLPLKERAPGTSWPRPRLARSELARAAILAARIERDVEARLAALYPYHVVRRMRKRGREPAEGALRTPV
jgi:hypothetical protein